jgi:hypothetical protein
LLEEAVVVGQKTMEEGRQKDQVDIDIEFELWYEKVVSHDDDY